MARIASGDTITVAPTSNIYTALAAAGFAIVLTGLILFFIQANAILGAGVLFSS